MKEINVTDRAIESLGKFNVHFWIESAVAMVRSDVLEGLKEGDCLNLTSQKLRQTHTLWSGAHPFAVGFLSIERRGGAKKSTFTAMNTFWLGSSLFEEQENALMQEFSFKYPEENPRAIRIISGVGVMPFLKLVKMKASDVIELSTSLSAPALMSVDNMIVAQVEMYSHNEDYCVRVSRMLKNPIQSPYRFISMEDFENGAFEIRNSPNVAIRLSKKSNGKKYLAFAGDTLLGSCIAEASNEVEYPGLAIHSASLAPQLIDAFSTGNAEQSNIQFEYRVEDSQYFPLKSINLEDHSGAQCDLAKIEEYFRKIANSDSEGASHILHFYKTRYERLLSPGDIEEFTNDSESKERSTGLTLADISFIGGDDSLGYEGMIDYREGHPCDSAFHAYIDHISNQAASLIEDLIGSDYTCGSGCSDTIEINRIYMSMVPNAPVFAQFNHDKTFPFVVGTVDLKEGEELRLLQTKDAIQTVDQIFEYAFAGKLDDLFAGLFDIISSIIAQAAKNTKAEFLVSESIEFHRKIKLDMEMSFPDDDTSMYAVELPFNVSKKGTAKIAYTLRIYIPLFTVKQLVYECLYPFAENNSSKKEPSTSTIQLNLEQLFYLLYEKKLFVKKNQILSDRF